MVCIVRRLVQLCTPSNAETVRADNLMSERSLSAGSLRIVKRYYRRIYAEVMIAAILSQCFMHRLREWASRTDLVLQHMKLGESVARVRVAHRTRD